MTPTSPIRPLTLTHPHGGRSVTFPTNALLAPMDGITDRCYRDLMVEMGDLGGACTEFHRVSIEPLPVKVFRKELGGAAGGHVPIGVQIMSPGADHLAETVTNAVAAGAPWIDLNFGCPVKRVFNKCAGSALLDHPEELGAIVAAAAGATDVPVTAKIRAGVTDDALLDDVLDACADAGAAAVILHARLRSTSYADPPRWDWISGAVERLHARTAPVPVIGNGGLHTAGDVLRMLGETRCDGVMVARGAFADPWIFREVNGGASATPREAFAFVRRYFDDVCPPGSHPARLNRFKQLVRHYNAAGVFDGREDERRELLRSRTHAAFVDWMNSRDPLDGDGDPGDPPRSPAGREPAPHEEAHMSRINTAPVVRATSAKP